MNIENQEIKDQTYLNMHMTDYLYHHPEIQEKLVPSGESTVIDVAIKDGKVEPIVIDVLQSMSTVCILRPDTDTLDASALDIVVKPRSKPVDRKPIVEVWVECRNGSVDVKWPDWWRVYDFDFKCSNTSHNDPGMTSIYGMQIHENTTSNEPEVALTLLCTDPIENNK